MKVSETKNYKDPDKMEKWAVILKNPDLETI